MLSKGFLVLLTLAVVGDKGYVISKPCFGSLLDYFTDDSAEDKPTKPLTPVVPPKITVFLTPVADIASIQSMIQASPNGAYYLLPSLLPLGQSSSTASPTTTTTTTTTAAPPPAPAAAAPAAAPPAAAAPAAPGAATPAPAAAG